MFWLMTIIGIILAAYIIYELKLMKFPNKKITGYVLLFSVLWGILYFIVIFLRNIYFFNWNYIGIYWYKNNGNKGNPPLISKVVYKTAL